MKIYDVTFKESFRKYVATLSTENCKKTIEKATEMIERFAVCPITHIERAELPNGVLIVEKENDDTLIVEMLDEISYTDVSFHIEKAKRALSHAIDLTYGVHTDIHEIIQRSFPHDDMESLLSKFNEIMMNMDKHAAHAERVRRERNERFTIIDG